MAGSVDRTPEVGVAVFILKGTSVLLGMRRTVTGKDTFAPPGGHLEFGESFEECASREVKEETGLDIEKIEVMSTINNVISNDAKQSHLIIICVRAILKDPNQDPKNIEPDKCYGWAWYEWDHLPSPLFGAIETLVKGGFSPFSSPTHLVINARN